MIRHKWRDFALNGTGEANDDVGRCENGAWLRYAPVRLSECMEEFWRPSASFCSSHYFDRDVLDCLDSHQRPGGAENTAPPALV